MNANIHRLLEALLVEGTDVARVLREHDPAVSERTREASAALDVAGPVVLGLAGGYAPSRDAGCVLASRAAVGLLGAL